MAANRKEGRICYFERIGCTNRNPDVTEKKSWCCPSCLQGGKLEFDRILLCTQSSGSEFQGNVSTVAIGRARVKFWIFTDVTTIGGKKWNFLLFKNAEGRRKFLSCQRYQRHVWTVGESLPQIAKTFVHWPIGNDSSKHKLVPMKVRGGKEFVFQPGKGYSFNDQRKNGAEMKACIDRARIGRKHRFTSLLTAKRKGGGDFPPSANPPELDPSATHVPLPLGIIRQSSGRSPSCVPNKVPRTSRQTPLNNSSAEMPSQTTQRKAATSAHSVPPQKPTGSQEQQAAMFIFSVFVRLLLDGKSFLESLSTILVQFPYLGEHNLTRTLQPHFQKICWLLELLRPILMDCLKHWVDKNPSIIQQNTDTNSIPKTESSDNDVMMSDVHVSTSSVTIATGEQIQCAPHQTIPRPTAAESNTAMAERVGEDTSARDIGIRDTSASDINDRDTVALDPLVFENVAERTERTERTEILGATKPFGTARGRLIPGTLVIPISPMSPMTPENPMARTPGSPETPLTPTPMTPVTPVSPVAPATPVTDAIPVMRRGSPEAMAGSAGTTPPMFETRMSFAGEVGRVGQFDNSGFAGFRSNGRRSPVPAGTNVIQPKQLFGDVDFSACRVGEPLELLYPQHYTPGGFRANFYEKNAQMEDECQQLLISFDSHEYV